MASAAPSSATDPLPPRSLALVVFVRARAFARNLAGRDAPRLDPPSGRYARRARCAFPLIGRYTPGAI